MSIACEVTAGNTNEPVTVITVETYHDVMIRTEYVWHLFKTITTWYMCRETLTVFSKAVITKDTYACEAYGRSNTNTVSRP